MYLLTEWEGRTGKYLARGPYLLTESQIFYRLSRPYSVNKHFIIWPLTVENFENSVWNLNRTRLHKIRRPRARNNHIQVSITRIYHLFLRAEQETLKKTTHFLIFVFQLQFMLKSQQKVDIKLSKMCQSHHASRFTENVVKTHENFGVVSSYLSGY